MESKELLERFMKMIPNEDFYNEFYDFDDYGRYELYQNSKFNEITTKFDIEEWKALWQIIDGWNYERLTKEVR